MRKIGRCELGVLALALLGCGGDPSDAPGGAGASGADRDDGMSASTGPRFAVDGRGESAKTSTVLEVIEGEPEVVLSITGADAADNLIVLYATIVGVDNVVGSHRLPIGSEAGAEVFAVADVDGYVYRSQSGELNLDMTAERHAEGRFDMVLVLDDGASAAPGAPAMPAAPELSIAGAFESEWTLLCRSPFPGGHLVSDSPYCNALTF